MRPIDESEDVSQDEPSLIGAERLVAYEQAKAAHSRAAANGVGDSSQSEAPLEASERASQGDPLANDLACVDLLHRVWPDFDDCPPQAEQGPPSKVLGDFRILREIGRGGMGVVYEAEQLSLARRVALKVLPFAAVLDERQLARFKNEAMAAALLKHPHIVTVYSVGCERGVHYYAMELVNGQSLAEAIAEFRQRAPLPSRERDPQTPLPGEGGVGGGSPARDPETPGDTVRAGHFSTIQSTTASAFFRMVAELGVQAAEALEYAHQNGVMHRDIKPANLICDARGKLSITDFGLARIGDATANLTMTGDLLGTLRYMSPEQALGKPTEIDHRTDVYSLGVTLYELLTLHPAFGEENRQQLFKAIADKEPRRPREVNRAIPADLETIVLKSIGKDAGDRYSSAQDLADDLGRFLADQPIRARRPNALQRARKWSRRHRAIVTTACAVAACALLIGTGLLWRERSQTLSALTEKNVALSKLEAEQDANYQNLYVARMHVAHQDWRSGQTDGMFQLLEQYLPMPGRRDLRGWEWYYLLSRGNCDLKTIADPGNTIYCISWGPNGKRLAAGGKRGLSVVDATTWKTLWRDPSRGGAFCWSPDGSQLAIAGNEFMPAVSICDAETGRRITDLVGHRNFISSIAWSPDGKRIAAGGCDSTCKVWDVASGKQVHTIGQRKDVPRGYISPTLFSQAVFVDWSPDGKRLVTANTDASIRTWEVDTWRELQVVATHGFKMYALALSKDGRRIAAAGSEDVVKVWDCATGREERSLVQTGGIVSLAFSPDGRHLAVGTKSARASIWDVETGQLVRHIHGNTHSPFSVAFSPDGRQIATGLANGEIKIWDAIQRQDALEFAGEEWSGPVVWHPGGHRIACGLKDGGVAVCEADTGKTSLRIEEVSRDLHQAAWSQDGRWLAWSADGSGAFHILDAGTGKPRHTLQHGSSVVALEISPNGQMIASVGTDQTVKIWDVATGRELATLAADGQGVSTISWSPDGSRVATADYDGMFGIWDVGTWKCTLEPRREPMRHYGRLRSCGLAWSPDGRWLASGGSRHTVYFWDVDQRRELCSLVGHNGPIVSLAWLAETNRLASAAADGMIKIWDTDSGQELLSLEAGGRVTRAAGSRDGRRLAAIVDGHLKIWDASGGYAIAQSSEYTKQRAYQRYMTGMFWGDSKEMVQEARRLDPEMYPRLCGVMGYNALETLDYPGAIDYFNIALESPSSLDRAFLYLARGIAYSRLEQFDEAIADFTQGLSHASDKTVYYAHRGRALRLAGRLQEAHVDLTHAIEQGSRSEQVWAYSERAFCHRDLGQFELALKDCNAALAIDSDNSAYYNTRASVHESVGKFAEAVADYEKSLKLDPDDTVALKDYGRLLIACSDAAFHDPARAAELGRRAIALRKEDADGWSLVGKASYRLGQWSTAQNALDEANRLQENRADVLFYRAMTSWKTGDKADATKWFTDADACESKTPPSDKEISRLKVEAAALMGL